MRRKKRVAIFRVALATGLVAAFMPTATQAKPLPRAGNDVSNQEMPVYVTGSLSPDDRSFERTAGEQVVIPYLSHGKGDAATAGRIVGSDDRSFARTAEQQLVVPYLSQGHGVTSAELGFAVSKSPDDRTYARGPMVETPLATNSDGISVDMNPYVVTGFGLALLLLAGGMGIAIRQSRKTRLSPA
jgi:hypothetical protein